MNRTVYLSNLSYKRDRNGIRSLLSRYGEIKSIKIIVEPTSGQSRGMAFAEMGTIEEAKKVIKGLNQQLIDGRTIKVNFATPLKANSTTKVKTDDKKNPDKDLEFISKQLAKKARNLKKRNSNPFAR